MEALAYISRRRSEAKVLVMSGHLPAALREASRRTTVSAVIRRLFRIGLLLGLLGGIAFALTKLLSNQAHDAPALARAPRAVAAPRPPTPPSPRRRSPAPIPDPEAPEPPTRRRRRRSWVEPTGGVCPTSHPVKAKLASKIFHLPGMANYDRTNPDRCYVDAAAAEADGLRAAKR